ESVSKEDAVQRLRLGYWLMLREGSFRQDLEETLTGILAGGLSTRRLILVTDSMAPDDLKEHGHIDHVLRRAIGLGLAPIKAIQAVTINPAVYSGLDQEIGGIAPGRCADFTLLSHLEKIQVESVRIGGRLVARKGESLFQGEPMAAPGKTLKSLRLSPSVTPKTISIECASPSARVRVMELFNHTITSEVVLQLYPRNGTLQADPNQDLMKVAVFDRHGESGRVALGFIKGFGARVGAVGTTVNLDEYALLIAGGNDEDMALCANTLIETGGGVVVVDRGEVLEKVDFPFGGLFSLDPWKKVGEGLQRIHRRLRERGSPFSKPIYTLYFLTFVTLPALRITDRGLVRAKDREIVPLFVDE
ncbi:MAG: adenine deaminase C-terminal domain-containing protein, partial [Candidatus Binatia bacterium]|nr:adenine deaminase C-terminal domain-containing protein [Candidatus Binatia bacterium]